MPFQKDVYKLQRGYPSDEDVLSTASIMKTATQHLLENPSVENSGYIFHYGPELGHLAYRQAVADLISTHSGTRLATPCQPENLVLTGGATHGLHLIASMFFRSGDNVFVENPSYFCGITMLQEDLKMNVIPVPTDEHGVDVEALDELLLKHNENSSHRNENDGSDLFSSLVYLIPTFNNPMGCSLEQGRCRRLVQIARRRNALILCDDVYSMLHYHQGDGSTPPRLLIDYDDPRDTDYTGGNILSNGSFSKILAPGLRVGWIESGVRINRMLEKSPTLFSGGAVNHYMSLVIAESLKLNLCQQHITRLREKYCRNLKEIVKIMKSKLPPSAKFIEPLGGYFIWIVLPEECSAKELLKISRERYKVEFLTGESCSPNGSFTHCVRICFTHYERDDLITAVTSLCDAINEYLGTKG